MPSSRVIRGKRLFVKGVSILILAACFMFVGGGIVKKSILRRDRSEFMDQCSKCHSLVRAIQVRKTEVGWRLTVERMALKDNSRDWAKGIVRIPRYLCSIRAPGGKDPFHAKCTRCHDEKYASRRRSFHEWLQRIEQCRKFDPFWLGIDEAEEVMDYVHSRLFSVTDLFSCVSCHLTKTGPSERRSTDKRIRYAGFAEQALQAGHGKCLSCHSRKTLDQSNSVEEWRAVIGRMASKYPYWIRPEEESGILESIQRSNLGAVEKPVR